MVTRHGLIAKYIALGLEYLNRRRIIEQAIHSSAGRAALAEAMVAPIRNRMFRSRLPIEQVPQEVLDSGRIG